MLTNEIQQQIADVARRAVLALKPEYCGTHTEIKLLDNRQLCVIETAARLPGITDVKQLERVFGIDMIGLHVQSLLHGEVTGLPAKMFTGRGMRATGNLGLLPVKSSGTPWIDPQRFQSNLPWSSVLSQGTRVELDDLKSRPEDSEIFPYDELRAAMQSLGLLYFESQSIDVLVKDQLNVMNNLESMLREASVKRSISEKA